MADYVKDYIGLNILVNDPHDDEIKDSSNDSLESGISVNNTKGGSTYSLESAISEQAILPILITHRNGPWGYSSWKQLRAGENTITKRERQYNKLSIVNNPVYKEVVVSDQGETDTILFRDLITRSYNEPCVVSKHKPLIVIMSREEYDDQDKRVELLYALEASYNNEVCFMTNDEVNVQAGITPIESEDYEALKKLYLDGALEDEESPFNGFRSFVFSQTVFPPEEYTFKSYTRKRINFVSGYWRDNRDDRTISTNHFTNYRTDTTITTAKYKESIWPLDSMEPWTTRESPLTDYLGARRRMDPLDPNDGHATVNHNAGILQNLISQYSDDHDSSDGLAPSFFYSWRADIQANVENNYQSITGPQASADLDNNGTGPDTPGVGDAFWDAPSQSGREPFDDNIDEFYEQIHKKYKDYSIIPEYKINDHIDFYLENGIKNERSSIFQITGAHEDNSDSSKEFFYKVYSNSDFFKNFDLIKKDHKKFLNPSTISLSCKAVKKLIPYNGFYPAQRSVDLGKQFYNSYNNNVLLGRAHSSKMVYGSNDVKFHFQQVYQPTFAPGVFFNTIKSGIACDFFTTKEPINTPDLFYIATGNDLYIDTQKIINKNLQKRIPFECLVEPQKYLANENLYLLARLEKNHLKDGSFNYLSASSFWDGRGDIKYLKMINNFLAETPEFFLKNKNFTTLRSKKQSDSNFANLESGSAYSMRLRCYKTTKTAKEGYHFLTNDGEKKHISTPQIVFHTGSSFTKENITMYSRPAAFGPSTYITDSNYSILNTGFNQGMYWEYTPPYYHGEGWTDITFVCSETKKYTIDEIISGSTMEHSRIWIWSTVDPTYSTYYSQLTASEGQTLINNVAMQNSASFNIFKKERGISNSLNQTDEDYLTIQCKFETPIINFNNVTTSSMTLPSSGSKHVPIGMWHQYGELPTQNEGIFLKIEDVPASYIAAKRLRFFHSSSGADYLTAGADEINNELRSTENNHKSLADALGFSTEPVRLGEVAKIKKIKEAVVAVPFFEEDGKKKFFSLPREDINNALNGNTSLCGTSVIDMVEKMKQYNFPPSMDFLNYQEVDPFAMYIFEFEHDLSQQDLSYIWQNLAPDIALNHEEAEASITHELLAHELLGGGAVVSTSEDGRILNESAKGTEFNSKIRWMVFKVKYRAKTRYYDKIIGKKDDISKDAGLGPTGETDLITYNWPYDFFSLVELVKLDASVEFSNIERDEKTRERVVKDIKPEPKTTEERSLKNPKKVIKRR